jgi:N-acetyl-1-D-myo-inositol-2-amino-2-deoxy-alpha-D-glucopyranoside deacetylase
MPETERVLFVHAHPDDETIETGGTIATLLAQGAAVTVLTCTRGERGEVIPDDLKPALESQATLAALRTSELATAMSILGVTDHRYLGDANARWSGRDHRHYTDSGMAWGAEGAEPTGEYDPTSLDSAPLGDVAADVAAVLVETRATAIVSYGPRGGYGHPDHIRAHDAARRAAEVYGIPYYAIIDHDHDAASHAAASPAAADIELDITAVLDRKRAALAAYRSQLTLDGDEIEFPGGQRRPVDTVERYVLERSADDEPVPFSEQHPAARFFAAILGGVIGVVLGALLTVYNGYTATIGGQPVWLGVILGSIVLAALFTGFRLAFGTRIVPGFAAVGAVVIIGILSLPSTAGSVLVTQSGPGLLWEIAPPVIAFLVLVWPQFPRRGPGKVKK